MESNNEAKEVTNGGFNYDNTSWASQQDSTSDLNDYFEGWNILIQLLNYFCTIT